MIVRAWPAMRSRGRRPRRRISHEPTERTRSSRAAPAGLDEDELVQCLGDLGRRHGDDGVLPSRPATDEHPVSRPRRSWCPTSKSCPAGVASGRTAGRRGRAALFSWTWLSTVAGVVAELGIGAGRNGDRRCREGLPGSGCSGDRRPRQTLGKGRHSDRRPGPAAGRRWAPSSGSAGRAVDIRSWRRRCKWLRRTERVLQRRGRRWPAPGAASGSWLGGDVVLSGHAEEPGCHRSATAGMTSWPITSSGPFFQGP